MLRLVIQVSMLLAIPLMALCLYIRPQYAAWYIAYVVMFNMLVGPVFSAGSVTGERERQTLDLLLTTILTPWQILWGKLLAGLRVSSVLTMFLLWPVMLACAMVAVYWTNLPVVAGYLGIVLATCLTTAMIALFCSVVFQKTSLSLTTTYLVIMVLFCAPLAATYFAETFFPDDPSTPLVRKTGIVSPFAAAFAIPLNVDYLPAAAGAPVVQQWPFAIAHLVWSALLNMVLLAGMVWLFRARWRVSSGGG